MAHERGERGMSEIDYLQLAKDRISEVGGNNKIAWVNCILNVAIADALVALVEELRKSNHATPNHCRHEIVRCRDCKHFEDGVCYRPDGDGDYARWIVEPVGFCAWGERKESGE